MDITIVIILASRFQITTMFFSFASAISLLIFFSIELEKKTNNKNKQQKQTNSIITTITNMPSQNYTRIVD